LPQKSWACEEYIKTNPGAELSAFAALQEELPSLIGPFIVDSALRDNAIPDGVHRLIQFFPATNQEQGIRQIAEGLLPTQNPFHPYGTGHAPNDFVAIAPLFRGKITPLPCSIL
jgi:hypothetical protein